MKNHLEWVYLIKIVEGIDDICAYCPENTGNRCKRQQKVEKYDKAYLDILQLETGSTIHLNEIKKRLKNRVTLADFHRICQKCSWYPLGICESIIQKIITEDEE